MKFKTWLWKGFMDRVLSNFTVVIFPFVVGSIITFYYTWGEIFWEFWMFIPMAIGLGITTVLGLYDLYLLDKRLETL